MGTQPVDPVDDTDANTLKAAGIGQHMLGAQRVAGAATAAVEHLRRALELAPDDYEAMAYLGSALTMLARDTWNPMAKVGRVLEGTALMDEAVMRAPDNVAVRFVRGTNGMALPGLFGRKAQARADFEYVLRAANDGDAILAPELLAEAHFRVAELYAETGSLELARTHWVHAERSAPDCVWAAEARRRLGA
jgi:tetratricopeptide (TPR) repeat protein